MEKNVSGKRPSDFDLKIPQDGIRKHKKLKSEKHSKKKHKKQKTLSSPDDGSCSSSDSERLRKKHKKKSKKKRKPDKKREKKKKHKQLTEVVKHLQQTEVVKNVPELEMGPSIEDARKAMAPMTKEEWEKQESVIRRVYDPDTGRQRLIKGSGEVLEEIVSRERHKEINKTATSKDGEYFQKISGLT